MKKLYVLIVIFVLLAISIYPLNAQEFTYNDFDFSTVVYVEDPAFKTDSVLIKNGNSYEMTLDAGKVYNRVRMDNVFQTVTCKSSKSSVAFIDENGVIYARKAGTANITTKINGKTYKIKVKVK